MKRIASTLAAMTLILAATGCQTMQAGRAAASQPKTSDLPPVPDRLRSFYQELKAGKFEILADLEQANQVQIFRVEGLGQAQLTVQRSRLATGAGALEVRLDEPAATLLIDDQKAKDWALPRDWRRYELFMASVFAPSPAVASLQIRSGTEQPATWDSAPLPLQKGWNLVRVDLAEVARQADLADVRQIRVNIKTDAQPYTFYLDDLMLADNTTTVYGDPKAEEGSLYVLKKGRRTHVGVTGRFELVFARGMLTGWYDLSQGADPTLNLAGTGPAGPVLTALDETGSQLGSVGIDSWKHLGNSVQTQLQIVETNSLVVTIKGTIRFTGAASDTIEDPPGATGSLPANAGVPGATGSLPANAGVPGATGSLPASAATQPTGGVIEHTYIYTVRKDGRVFVDIRAQIASEQFTPGGVGLAIAGLQSVLTPRQVDPLDRSNLIAHKAASPAPSTEPRAGDGVGRGPPAHPAGAAAGPPSRQRDEHAAGAIERRDLPSGHLGGAPNGRDRGTYVRDG